MSSVTISVVMPIHAGVDPAHLDLALRSLADQTRPADEIVLVEDGPLTDAQHEIVGSFIRQDHPVVRVVRPTNGGAGLANQSGLERATGDWIAKADADDINVPTRFDRQLAFVTQTEVDVCGAAMVEFSGTPDNVTAVRRNPPDQAGIARRMRINSPINHPTAFYRRTAAVAVGGYSDLRFMQDYDLWARMLMNGATFANMSDPLVKFRADERMYRRRTSRAMNRCEWTLQHNLRSYGLTSTAGMWWNLVVRLVFRRLPRPLLKLAYRLFLHGRGAPR